MPVVEVRQEILGLLEVREVAALVVIKRQQHRLGQERLAWEEAAVVETHPRLLLQVAPAAPVS